VVGGLFVELIVIFIFLPINLGISISTKARGGRRSIFFCQFFLPIVKEISLMELKLGLIILILGF